VKYSDELGKRLKAAYEEGMTIRDVAGEFTLSFGTARKYLLRAGTSLRGWGGARPARGGTATPARAHRASGDDSPISRILNSMQSAASRESPHVGGEETPKGYTPALGAKLKTAYERGMSIRDVADIFGLKFGTARNYLLRAGTSLRGQGAAGHSRGGFRRVEPTTRLRNALR